MNRAITIAIVLLINGITAFGQQKEWETKTISQWTFEKFPTHYSVKPAKAIASKNAFTGILEDYREQNELGQPNGLTLTMRPDGLYAQSAIYTYKGTVVYNVSFFPSSKKAESITSYNEEGLIDGYKIYRTLKAAGGYDEDVEKYDNGKLIEINGVKQTAASASYVDSLLNGPFKFDMNAASFVIDGEADMGELERIRQAFQGKYSIREITFKEDSFIVKIPSSYTEGEFTFETYPIVSIPKITQSRLTCLEYGNYSGFPYLYLSNRFNIQDLEAILRSHYPEPLKTIVSYSDSLLDGDFQYREYDNRSQQYSGVYTDVLGTAVNGRLLNISLTTTEMSPYDGSIASNKRVEYIFQDNSIIQNDYVPQVSDAPVQTKTIKVEYPVRLTNSHLQGGLLKFYSDRNSTYNVLGVPYQRNAKLEASKYGYAYFSPFTFDMTNFLRMVTTPTPRPVERKIQESKGLLDGDFEFRKDGIHFVGLANNGIVESLDISYDFEMSKWIGDAKCKYDQVNIELSEGVYNLTYSSNDSSNSNCVQVISFTQNRKLTNSVDLEEYDGFVYYKSDNDLRNILKDLKFTSK